jgi:hypothetical protein
MRRHDYAVDVLGGATGAHYIHDYHQVSGIMVAGFEDRIFPAFKASIFCPSLSMQTTVCPKSARHAPDTSPT